MTALQKLLIEALIKIILSQLSKDKLVCWAKAVCDFARQQVLGTASPIDDAIVLPIVEKLERELGL